MRIGAHESIAGGLTKSVQRAVADGCRSFQIFTKSASTWKEPVWSEEQVASFRAAHAAAGSPPVLVHTSYLINLAAEDLGVWARSKEALIAEILRASRLGVSFVVLHPGAHLGRGIRAGIARVAAGLEEVHARTEGATARILLENTAGQGTCLGSRMEEIGDLLEAVHKPDRLGFCFDTQHAFAAGYNLSTEEGYEATFRDVDTYVGLARLCAFHLNDSKKPCGSRVDRHEHLGEGHLGLFPFWRLAREERFRNTPAVLETEPRSTEAPYKDEVTLLELLGKAQDLSSFASSPPLSLQEPLSSQ